MYIKTTKNSLGQSYYHLVESYREGKKVRQRTLLSLGRVQDNKIGQLVEALSRHGDNLGAISAAKDISVDKTYILGPLLVVDNIFKEYGIYAIINNILTQHPKLEFDFKKDIFTLIAARFIKPSSKLFVYEKLLDILYPELINSDLSLQHIYRSIDLLSQHKDEIESSLYWHNKDLLNHAVDIVLYDLTTLRFERT